MPHYSEIASLYGYASKSVAYKLVRKLIKAGIVEKDSKGRLIPKFGRLGIPLVGYVQAGFPSPAEEELVDVMSLDDYLIRRPQKKANGIQFGLFEDPLHVIKVERVSAVIDEINEHYGKHTIHVGDSLLLKAGARGTRDMTVSLQQNLVNGETRRQHIAIPRLAIKV